MPTYVYKREDGTTFELVQSITSEPLSVCPTTQQSVHRVISGGTGFIFKGSGFYQTDYVSNQAPSEEPKEDSKDSKSSKADPKPASEKESTTETSED